MQRPDTRLGSCPECGVAIRPPHVLVTYETDGSTARFAECPGCETVVHPVLE